jgi:hypothetical protein
MSVTFADRINASVALSPAGTWFRLEGSGHAREREGSRFLVCLSFRVQSTQTNTFQTEIRAGVTTWVSVRSSYVMVSNSRTLGGYGLYCEPLLPSTLNDSNRSCRSPSTRQSSQIVEEPAFVQLQIFVLPTLSTCRVSMMSAEISSPPRQQSLLSLPSSWVFWQTCR